MRNVDIHLLFGTRIYQYLAAVTSTLCIVSSEMHFGWSSPSIPHLTKGTYKFQITNSEASWLAAILLVGTTFGAIMAGRLTDVLGRKKVILLTTFPLLVGWLMIGFAEDVRMLYIARFVAGLSSGISFSTVPMYLGEIAEPEVRGLLASICPVCVVFGILLINILGNYLPIDTAAFVSSGFPVILFITFIWMPESPSFLLQKGRIEDAKRTLVMLRGKEDSEKELARLTTALKELTDTNYSILSLFRDKVNRKAAVIAYGLRTIQQLTGTTALTFYCKTIFEKTEKILSSNISTILYFSVQLVIAFLSIFIVDRVGRKPLLIVSLIGTTLTLFLLSEYLFIEKICNAGSSEFISFLEFTALMSNVAFVSLGVRNIPLLMMGELFSPTVKPVALCFGTIYYSIIAMVSAKLFFFTTEHFGMYVPFSVYTVFTFLSIFFVAFLVPETKGMNLEEIQNKLKEKQHAETNEKLPI